MVVLNREEEMSMRELLLGGHVEQGELPKLEEVYASLNLFSSHLQLPGDEA